MHFLGALFFSLGVAIALIIALLPHALKLLKYILTTLVVLLCFVLEKSLRLLSWIAAAIYASAYGFYALGQQFFTGTDAKSFIAEMLPTKYDLRKRAFSLLLIELMLVSREKFVLVADAFKLDEQD